MARALICSQADLTSDLGQTPLWRAGVERLQATRMEEAHVMALAARPDIVVVDRDLPGAERLVAALREDSSTRGLSIAVLARGDFEPAEVELLEAGANAILRLPAGPEWGDRLQELMSVPVRAQARLAVRLSVMALRMTGVPWSGLGLNLSRNGMLVETDAELRLGDQLDLEFALVEDGSPLRTEGRVVRLAGPRQVGVQFPGLSSEVRAHIESFVETGHTA